MTWEETRDFLNFKAEQYNTPSFIEEDPIQIPHSFKRKEDIEIMGFLVATIAWGNRKSILNSGERLIHIFGNSPYDFVMEYNKDKEEYFDGFVHRTFNSIDLAYFVESLKNIYSNHGGLESVFTKYATRDSLQPAIHEFKKVFFEIPHPKRTQKHVGDPNKNSAAKRINMYLRWMVRNDNKGVDFGLWNQISPSQLSCPLDVHSGNIARKLGVLKRKQNDAKAVVELDAALRKMDPKDPVKYDFALFGLGVYDDL